MTKTKTKEAIPQVGDAVAIRAIPFHYVGRIAVILPEAIILTDACWLADSGRWSEFLSAGTYNECEPYPDPVAISRSAIVDVTLWRHTLPLAKK